MSKDNQENLGIYIHFPYCERKCPYCAFNSFEVPYVPNAYISGLAEEARMAAGLYNLSGIAVDTIYMGGGTPSLCDAEGINKLLHSLENIFKFTPSVEISIETNPSSGTKEKLKIWKESGVNRLSIGVQSFCDEELHFLGRLHNSKEAEEFILDARKSGFDNIGLDMIIGIPGQTEEKMLFNLKRAVDLDPEHLSLYLLTFEEGTPMGRGAEKGLVTPLKDEIQETLFFAASEFLASRGYTRYETSNYSRSGFESRHNMKYWNGSDYIGLGAGAHSYLSDIGWGQRWWNEKNPERYMELLGKGMLPLEELELLTRGGAIREAILTGLRTTKGLKEEYVQKRFNTTLSEIISKEELQIISDNRMIIIDKEGIALSEKGALFTDEIAGKITF